MTTENKTYIEGLNQMIAAEEEKINGLYTLLGKRCFEVYTDSNDAELEQLVSKVRAAMSNIDEYKGQIEKLSATVSCPNCDGAVSADAQFCSVCGFNMNSTDCCKSCGAVINDGFAFCVKCGAKVAPDEEIIEAPVVDETPTIEYDINVAEETVAEETPKADVPCCTVCGTALTDGFAFCTECGTKVAAPEAEEIIEDAPAVEETPTIEYDVSTTDDTAVVDVAAEEIADEASETDVAYCTVCGTALTEGFAFCTECGTKVAAPEETPEAPAEDETPTIEYDVSTTEETIVEDTIVEEAVVEETVAPEEAPIEASEPIAQPVEDSWVEETIAVTASRCKSCGAIMEAGFAFCTECGARAAAEAPVATPSFCTNCGLPVAQGGTFCTNCGNRLA